MHQSVTQLALDDYLASEIFSTTRRPARFPRPQPPQPLSRLHRRLLFRYQLPLNTPPTYVPR